MSSLASGQEPAKSGSALYPPEVVARLQRNAAEKPWVGAIRDSLIAAARPWMERSDDDLWRLMFGPTIPRSWMVWSNGHCPACGQDVPMYNWEIDALERPWKVRCPHCQELFPKNDFEAFYESGLDEAGIFQRDRADGALLFNGEHPDPSDPLHGFGVDDGEGYVADGDRWRFIGTYLIYGQWKQAVLGGIRTLSSAYAITGDPAYAHKAAVLLDRVADLYPTFDYKDQAFVYERKLGSNGYVSIWHDCCEETRQLALAYDMIFPALCDDTGLVAFLGEKAAACGLENPKASFGDVQRNIEGRILRDALAHPEKIHSNYPRREIAMAVILTTLGGEDDREQARQVLDEMLTQATAVDGVTGEKGLANYSAFVIQSLAQFLGEFAKADPDFLPDILERHPRLHDTYRFHIDTWCLHEYYPLSGDTGWFAKSFPEYVGMTFTKAGAGGLAPSMFTLLWDLYEATGDPAFVQVLFRTNGHTVAGLPHDLYAGDEAALQQDVLRVMEREGSAFRLDSVDKQQWHIAVLRSGEGRYERALWLDYDSGGGHSHADGMNLGLFAQGLDLMPDFGYPPVHFGGWDSSWAGWYKKSMAHNTVLVDGRDTNSGAGATTLWADGDAFHAIRAAGPEMNRGNRYERTAVLVDVSPTECYVVDVFRVAGGSEHTKFMHSHFATATPTGLALEPDAAADFGEQMRAIRVDADPEPGWSVEWDVEDYYGLLDKDADVRLRYTDFTPGAEAGMAEAWIVAGTYNSTDTKWIPRVFVRRRADDEQPLESTFVSVIEPYQGTRAVRDVERLALIDEQGVAVGDGHVALAVTLADGRRDVILARDSEDEAVTAISVDAGHALQTDAELCLVRFAPKGEVAYVVCCNVTSFECGPLTLRFPERRTFVELRNPDGVK